jgi:alpha-tubulin suppressor-like RCC1 family protein
MHSVAVTSNNEIWSWGSNKYGQLGIPNYEMNMVLDINIY